MPVARLKCQTFENTTCFFGAVAGLEPTLPLFLFCYVPLQVYNNSCNFAPANLWDDGT